MILLGLKRVFHKNMGTVCLTKRGDDPNDFDEVRNSEGNLSEMSTDEPYSLNSEIKKGVVVIYIHPKFKECERVQELFRSINMKPIVVDVSKDSNPKKLLHSLKKLTKDPNPPYVFLTGKYFGGLNEIDAGIKNHTVQKIINKWLDSRVGFSEY
ncbi:hypothetical protein SteCoe_2822 [Stentor coeruleus]|uniref:Glutaredoxin domain-containing protein n=1 Tax=Stentor coeruleus TaxID=5963 RepID=A0A1R2CYH1_9CILI|nr:hypothetical protein SteCoe_2822 [Stentor coeruleus]